MIKIKSSKKAYGIMIPTSMDEITPDFLKTITSNIKLPKHYCIIGLCLKTKLFDIATVIGSNNKDLNVFVNPILCKINNEDIETVNANVGDKIIVSRTNIEMGDHIAIPITISNSNIKRYLYEDEELRKAIITKNKNNTIDKNNDDIVFTSDCPSIIVMEFKIIPVVDIKASIDNTPVSLEAFKFYPAQTIC